MYGRGKLFPITPHRLLPPPYLWKLLKYNKDSWKSFEKKANRELGDFSNLEHSFTVVWDAPVGYYFILLTVPPTW